MNSQLTVSEDKVGEYRLSGDLNMKTVTNGWPDKQKIIQQLKQTDGSLNVDFSGITHVDTSGLAWVMHLTKACQKQQLELKLHHLPVGLINLAKLSNVDGLLPIQ
ncbi:STAS domain-containing protein [Aliiglaciecola sp.]|nr:STAS domain-containing protein [Aliiglaciecola sp.]